MQKAFEALHFLLATDIDLYKPVDRDRLRLLRQVLMKWNKASSWLGIPQTDQLTTLQITQDARYIHHALREKDAFWGGLSTVAYVHLRKNQFDLAERAIPKGKAELEGLNAVKLT